MIDYQKEDRVVTITLTRPESRNAFDPEMTSGMEAAIDRFEADDDAWIGVITGKGSVFCAGADLRTLSRGEGLALATKRGGFAGFVRRERTKPIIAAVNGPALAGGFEITLACDLVVASENAMFGLPEVRWSLIAAAGGLIRLPRTVSRNVAMEIALTGEPINAQRAYELGIVNQLCGKDFALERALELARRIAKNSPLAVRASRKVLLTSLFSDEAQAWRTGNAENRGMMETEDFAEGPRAFVEKRDPVWRGR